VTDVANRSAPTAPAAIKRAPWWIELVLIGAAYLIYSWISDRAPRGAALSHGGSILRFERDLRINIEHSLNHWWTSGGHSVIVGGNLYYDLMHFIVPVGTLLWVYFFRHQTYVRVRTPLLLVSLAALAVFWLYPTAPPRLIPSLGLYDTIANVHTLGGGGSHGMTAAENPFAAPPSLHVAWATWACYAVWCSARSVLARSLLAANVAIMAFLVVATGNHWVSDVLAGMAGVALAVWVTMVLRRAWHQLRGHPVSATEPDPASIVDARR
jgi:hypothetical protein